MLDLWEATAGAEERVKAAEGLFDHPVDLDATRRFLQDETKPTASSSPTSTGSRRASFPAPSSPTRLAIVRSSS
jgi:hypothetical protein